MILSCPSCNDLVYIDRSDINCGIFRHAVMKTTMEPIDPHASFETCELLVYKGLVYGCAKPFRIIDDVAYRCEYI